MTTLGIDPGFERTGFGVVREEKGKLYFVEAGCIITQRGQKDQDRLVILYRKSKDLFRRSQPDYLALESLFFAKNAKTAMLVGQARGVILLAAGERQIPVVTYAPLEVKLAVTGYGNADKQQVQRMVASILKLSTLPKPDDVADALAVALTHCFSYKTKKQELNL